MEKTTQQGALFSVLLTKYFSGNQIKTAEMDRACRTYVGEVLVGKPEGRRRFGGSSVDGRIILKWILEKWDDVAQDRDRWLAVLNAVMNLLVS